MDRIKRIERRALVMVIAAAALSVLLWQDSTVTLGVSLGGGLELLNFHLLRRLIEKILDSTSPEKVALIATALALKFVWLAMSIYVCLRFLPVDGVAFTVGIILIIAAIAFEAMYPGSRRR